MKTYIRNMICKLCNGINKNETLHFDLMTYIMDNGQLLNTVLISDFLKERGILTKQSQTNLLTGKSNREDLKMFLKDLESLNFINIVYENIDTRGFPDNIQQSEGIVITVRILPKGVEYVLEQRKSKSERAIKKITLALLIIATMFSSVNLVLRLMEVWCKQ